MSIMNSIFHVILSFLRINIMSLLFLYYIYYIKKSTITIIDWLIDYTSIIRFSIL